MDITLDELKKYYSNPREKEYLSEGLKEEKLFKALYEKSTIKKGKKLTFEELLKDYYQPISEPWYLIKERINVKK